VTPSGIETTTFWFVAQCLNQINYMTRNIQCFHHVLETQLSVAHCASLLSKSRVILIAAISPSSPRMLCVTLDRFVDTQQLFVGMFTGACVLNKSNSVGPIRWSYSLESGQRSILKFIYVFIQIPGSFAFAVCFHLT
jgi:hypothetical protein